MTSHQKIFKVVSTTSESQYPTFSLFSASFFALERESTIMQSSQRWDKWPVMLFWNESVSWGTKGVLIEPNEDWVLGKQAFQGFADASLISTQRYNALSVLLQMPVSCRAYLLSYNILNQTPAACMCMHVNTWSNSCRKTLLLKTHLTTYFVNEWKSLQVHILLDFF